MHKYIEIKVLSIGHLGFTVDGKFKDTRRLYIVPCNTNLINDCNKLLKSFDTHSIYNLLHKFKDSMNIDQRNKYIMENS